MTLPFLALVLTLLAAPPAQDPKPPPPPPAPEAVRSAVEALERAFSKGESGERVRAIEAAAELADESVVGQIARGLDDKEPGVRQAAVKALRFQSHPKAIEPLNAALKKQVRREIPDQELAALITAVGQHASRSSLELLAGGTLERTHEHSTRARILALGRIRDPEAVAELIALMNKAGQGQAGAGNLYDRDFRLALWALTGRDEGAARESWMRWWNDNKRTLEIAPEPALEPRPLALQWRRLWARPRAQDEGPPGPGKRRKQAAGGG
jgi:HEAT repeat protein